MSKALPHPVGPVFSLSPELMSNGREASRLSPRLRTMQPIQRSQESRVQRLLNFLQPGTYIQPHCHPLPHATESVCLLAGALDILIFDENGALIERHPLTLSSPLIDIEPGTWHGMIVQAPDTVIFEVKQGPYDPTTDKTFAAWAPPEGSPKAAHYLAGLSHQ
ncbi:WbuC family cupin fold metalloprotein [Verrucomicrobiaceae bacterium 227]